MPTPAPAPAQRPARAAMRRLLVALADAVGMVESLGALLLNATVPSGRFRVTAGIPYGAVPACMLDLYLPRAPWPGPGPRPTVLFLHGGRWETGHRGMYRFVAEALVSRGWAVVVPDYRKYPQVRWPVFVEDCADALEWTARHAGDWEGAAGRIVAMGHSAGAHLATLLALDRRLALRMPGLPALHAVIGLSGPYDFLPLTDADLQDMFGTAADLRETQPLHHVEGRCAPMLLIHGDADTTVKPRNTRNLAAALRSGGSVVEEIHYPGLDHVRTVLALAWPFRRRHRVLEDIAAFLARLEGPVPPRDSPAGLRPPS